MDALKDEACLPTIMPGRGPPRPPRGWELNSRPLCDAEAASLEGFSLQGEKPDLRGSFWVLSGVRPIVAVYVDVQYVAAVYIDAVIVVHHVDVMIRVAARNSN